MCLVTPWLQLLQLRYSLFASYQQLSGRDTSVEAGRAVEEQGFGWTPHREYCETIVNTGYSRGNCEDGAAC